MSGRGIRGTTRAAATAVATLLGILLIFAMAGPATAQPSGSGTAPVSAAAIPVTAIAPTGRTIGCGGMDNLFTIPRVTGVQYLVNDEVLTPSDYLVSDYSSDDTVQVSARALAGYVLTGRSSWTVVVAAPTCTPPAVIPHCRSFTVTNKASYAIGFSWRAHGSTTEDGYYSALAPGTTRTVTTRRSQVDYFYAPADHGMQFSIGQVTVPQNCAAPSPSATPTSTGPATPRPTQPSATTMPATTSATTSSATTKVTGPAIVTDGGSTGGDLNGLLLTGALGCAVGAALAGTGLWRRLTH